MLLGIVHVTSQFSEPKGVDAGVDVMEHFWIKGAMDRSLDARLRTNAFAFAAKV